MQRIQSSSAVAAKPAQPVMTGPVGYFTNGVPGTLPATILPDWWLNLLQEEIVSVIAAAGIGLDSTNDAQLLAAIRIMASQASPFTAVQQGGGPSQGNNKINIGWDSPNAALRASVDGQDLGHLVTGMTGYSAHGGGYAIIPMLPLNTAPLIFQWGFGITSSSGLYNTIYPLTFPNECVAWLPVTTGATGYATSIVVGGIPGAYNAGTYAVRLGSTTGANGGEVAFSWIAVGH